MQRLKIREFIFLNLNATPKFTPMDIWQDIWQDNATPKGKIAYLLLTSFNLNATPKDNLRLSENWQDTWHDNHLIFDPIYTLFSRFDQSKNFKH